MITSNCFSEAEFKQCSPSCSLQDMQQSTMNRMDKARQIAGIPFVITSAFRPTAWDKARGRSGTGAHTLGRAVDIRCHTSSNRFKIIDALLEAGFKRIGVAKTFIHADDSPGHAQAVIWVY